uniref:M-phase phosphoprotein 6 n=1 Tax=Kalanchoe fedtschenkoi TaxID=63787 RepID=A0A7N0U396_KALFE
MQFMQRAAQKEEKKKEEEEEEVVSDGGFGSATSISKKCVVIMEGDPHPGAVKGRMSFQRFNPTIDKLAEELDGRSKEPGARTPASQNGSFNGEGSANEDSDTSNTKMDHKRKQPVGESEELLHYPNKSPKNSHGNQRTNASSSGKKRSNKKREKNDWSVLRPPKSENR